MRIRTTMFCIRLRKRLPFIGGLFLFFGCVFFSLAFAGWFTNTPVNTLQHASVKYVIDGDTIRLSDGQLVRLIGINSFELKGKQQRAGEIAKKALSRLLLDKEIKLKLGKQERDRHGRLLAYVFSNQMDVQQQMLAQGQAMVVAFPPNIEYINQYALAEQKARATLQGIWANPGKLQIDLTQPYSSQEVKRLGGFAWIKARVINVTESRKNFQLQLTESLSVSISKQDWQTYWKKESATNFVSKVIDVRGWVSTGFQNKRYLKVRHPVMLHIVEQ